MPEVKVISVPDHAQNYARALREFPFFERLKLSAEDREHTRMYHEQQERTQLAQSVNSLEDFYRSLDQEVVIAPVGPDTIARVAQLTQKTNQYNVTTRRYTEQQIEEFASQPGCGVYSVHVKDRFGDNGIVGVLITRIDEDICEIDTFLLSCRVIGRTIETAMLGFVSSTSKAKGAKRLQGWFLPTKKNSPRERAIRISPVQRNRHEGRCNALEFEFGGSRYSLSRMDPTACHKRLQPQRTISCLTRSSNNCCRHIRSSGIESWARILA